MPVKTVTLTVDAYNALAAAKEEGESFSAVVRKLTGSHVRLTDFAGAWKDAPRSEMKRFRRFLKQSDEASRRDLESLLRDRRRH